MQFGEALDYSEAEKLFICAADLGISVFDSAEMYPVPQRATTQGRAEEFLGVWLQRQDRTKFKVCTKAAGPSGQMTYLRGGPHTLDRSNILQALEGSLRRLRTDFIDLYLLHWPDRYVPMFGETDYQPELAYSAVPIEEQLEALAQAQQAGKIREFGVSNETAWGLMRFCELARYRGLPKITTIQNAYSLVCRSFDSGLAECCHQESVKMMAYSPLAMGLLTGKYRHKAPANARLVKYRGRYAEAESRYGPKPSLREAVSEYCKLAEQAGMEPYELAIRFVIGQPLLSTTVLGVTNEKQLKQLSAAAANGPLDEELLDSVNSIHRQFPNPAP